MTIRAYSCLLALALALMAQPALALPPPMSEQELTDKSDLIAVVRVLSVTCTGVKKDDATGEELPGYLARLRVIETKKGDANPGDEVLVSWRAAPTTQIGSWAVSYYPGEVVLTHLKKSSAVTYGSTWWNAKGDDIQPPDSTNLPTTPGESVPATPKKPSGPVPL